MRNRIQPRDLKTEERAVLEFLMTAEFPGRDDLNDQLKSVMAVGVCDCGCGTIDLAVKDRDARATTHAALSVEAFGSGVDVLLFVRDGILSCLEIVPHSDERPVAYPAPAALELRARPKNPTE